MSYIGKQPRKTALTASDIEDGIITAAKIEDGAVVAAEIASNAVTTAKINADAVTGAKIADDAINSEHYTDGSVDTAHIADANVTSAKIAGDAITAAKIADDAISDEHLDVTAITGQTAETSIADGDTILIHDASASALRKMTKSNFVSGVGETNTPMFSVDGPNLSVSHNTATKLTVDSEKFDPQSTFDLGSNNRFTPAKAGKYQFNASVQTQSGTNTDYLVVDIRKNGSGAGAGAAFVNRDYNSGTVSAVLESDDNDYFEVYVTQQTGGSINIQLTNFSGFYVGT